MLRVLLPLFLLIVTLETTVGECIDSNFQTNTHSIKKRDTKVWCTAKGCTTCIDKVCQQTCKGFICGDCPSGNCCNGINCNACYNSSCCSTPSCNYCISTCRQACFNETTCENICIPQCQYSKHDVFVVQPNTITPGQQEVMVYIKGVPYKGRVTSGQIPTTNKTGTVTVDGVDHPATVLALLPGAVPPTPVTSPPCNNNPSNGPNQIQMIAQQNNNNQLQQGCCHVVHPQQCYNTPTYPYHHCFRRTHQECSNLCSSQYVHLVPNLRSQPQAHHQCHYISTYPYVYCGQHSVQNCDPCYVCNGQYNPYSCVQQVGCSNSCRQTFTPSNLSPISLPNTQPIQQPEMGPYQLQLGGAPFQYG